MKRILLGFVLLFFATTVLQGQQYSWTSFGPDNMGGLTRALAFDAEGNLLAGAQGGGLWISKDEGGSWQRVASFAGNPNITDIHVSGSNIYVATGATVYIQSSYSASSNFDFRSTKEGFKGYLKGLPGGGVYVSNDNGQTWSNDNAITKDYPTLNYKGPFVGIQRVIKSGSRIIVGTMEGIYYSDDELATIQPVTGSDALMGAIIFDLETGADGVIYAGTHNIKDVIDDSLYISTDNGASFKGSEVEIFFQQVKFSFQRTEIAVSKSDPKLAYVGTTQANGEIRAVFRTKDNGKTWENFAPAGNPNFNPLGTTGRQAFILEVFPDNDEELIIAGNSWFTFTTAEGWVNTATHGFPGAANYIPRKQYRILFDPNDSKKAYIGTDFQITKTDDRGLTFSRKSSGYSAGITYSVGAIPLTGFEALMAGTASWGTIYNANFTADSAFLRTGFARIGGVNASLASPSYTHSGVMIRQSSDDGVERTLNLGNNFERFYGLPISPQVKGLNGSDTIIDNTTGTLTDGGGADQIAWLIDEYIPDNLLDREDLPKDSLEGLISPRVYFTSKKYLWVTNEPYGELLQVKWNRLSNSLISGPEFITTIGSSDDATHTMFVGTSKGKIYRASNTHLLQFYDVGTNVVRLDNKPASGLTEMRNRWLSSISVDPQNPNFMVITFAGYGGDVAAATSMVWYTNSAGAPAPLFLPMMGLPIEPAYSSLITVDPATGNSVVLIGTESSLYSNQSAPGGSWTKELTATNYGNAPIYQIAPRKYKMTIYDPLSGDFKITKDNSIFVASHGRGVWGTTSLSYQRKGDPTGPVEPLSSFKMVLYPNPTVGPEMTLQLDLPEAARINTSLIAMDGRRLGSDVNQLEAGRQELSIPMEGLTPGVYFLNVEIKGETLNETRVLKAVVTQ